MLIIQGIMYELPPFEKYWTHMFQNKYMPVVGECQCEVLPFSRLRNELFSPEEDTNKYKYAMIGGVAVTAAKVLLADILDEQHPSTVASCNNGATEERGGNMTYKCTLQPQGKIYIELRLATDILPVVLLRFIVH